MVDSLSNQVITTWLRRALIGVCCCLSINTGAQEPDPYRITVLATNIANYGGFGEWSFSALYRSDSDAVLFDTGFDEDTVLHNARVLKLDLSDVEKVVLSHFHGDHTGGLLTLRETFRTGNPRAFSRVFVAEGFFDQRWAPSGQAVGPGGFAEAQDFRKAAESLGITFTEIAAPMEIAPRLWLTGPVERQVEAYNGPPGFTVADGDGRQPDVIMDDQSLGYLTDKGWVMMSGCGHSGLINTGMKLQSIRDRPVYSIVGGFHLWRAEPAILDRTAQWLADNGLGLMMGGHCTGIAAAEHIAERVGLARPQISHAAIGSVITRDLQIIRSSVE